MMSKQLHRTKSVAAALAVATVVATVVATLGAPRAGAQSAEPHCRPLCAPSLTLMPGVIRTHLFGGPVVQTLATGAQHRLAGTSIAEVIVAVASKTAIPRVSLFGSAQWLPNASEARNPFTLYTAQELGAHVHANAPTLTFGVSTLVLPAQATHGWLDVAANVGDLFSAAARPGDQRAYTHKLDLDLVTHVHALAWTPAHSYAHRATVYGILDYVATGLPKTGDEVPHGRRFLTNARPAAVIVGLALPLTPTAP